MNNKKFIAYLLAIIAFGILLRLWNFTPALGNDDQRWVTTSQGFGEPRDSGILAVYYDRILWRSLLASWGYFAGLSLTTTPWLMFTLSCLTALMIGLAGRVAFNPSVGLWAAAFYSTHPLAVVYDVLTLPDGLATFLLATAMYCLLKFFRSDRSPYLAICGVLVGLSYSAKGYYVLAAIPAVAILLLSTSSRRTSFRKAAFFSAFVALGLSANVVLRYWETGLTSLAVPNFSEYGERIVARGGAGAAHEGLERIARVMLERFNYLRWLLSDMGFVTGFLTVWGTVFLFFESRRSICCVSLAAMTVVFFLFLMFFPATMHPFTFVEMQPRYLGILLPMIAIGSGICISAVAKRLPARSARRGFVVAIMLGLASNVMVPNDLSNGTFNRSARQQFDGIRHLLVHAEEEGISEFIFPDLKHRQITPNIFYSLGPTISYYDASDGVAACELRDRILESHSAVVFVPRRGFNWPLAHELRRGEYQEIHEINESHQDLIEWLESNGFSRRGVKVPDTVFMDWASWAGLVSREQQLVGWLYERATAPTKEADKTKGH